MKKILFVFILLISFCSCKKHDRIDHYDDTHIYVWKYDIHGDSTLMKYHQPVMREFNVMGGHHKHHHIKVDFGDGYYTCCSLPYDGSVDRCQTVSMAMEASRRGRPLKGIFIEYFYPWHYYEFVRYK